MANQRRPAKGNNQRKQTAKLIRFAVIPLTVVSLIIIIVAADRRSEGKNDSISSVLEDASEAGMTGNGDGMNGILEESYDAQPGQETIVKSENTEEDVGQEQQDSDEGADTEETLPELADPLGQPLQQDSMLELTGLVRLYCEAKTECDPELLEQVFGIEDWSDERKDQERAKMELVKASIKSYENISCYLVQGPEEDSYVIFPYYEIRYREIETLMPAISWAYVKKNENGQYYMVSTTDAKVNEYIRKVGEKPEVKAVMGQVFARQEEAVAQDEVLQRIYGEQGSEVIVGGAQLSE